MSLRCLVIAVLAAAALGKLWRRAALERFAAVLGLGLGVPGARLVALGWSAIEGACALLLALPPTAAPAAVLATLELAVLTAGAAVLVARRTPVGCPCFGAGDARLTWRTVLRNAALTAAALLLAIGLRQPRTSPPAAVTLAAVLTVLAVSLLVLRSLPAGPARLPATGPDVGSAAPPIRTRTGATIESAGLGGGPHLVAFLSSSCPGCRSALPALADYVGPPGSSLPLVAVVTGDPQRAVDIEQLLAPTATVVLEPDAGPIAAAYRITVFPSYVLVSADATVLAAGYSVRDLPQPQPR